MLRIVAILACATATACAAGTSSPTTANAPDDCPLVGKAAVAYTDISRGLVDRTITQQDAADRLDTLAADLRDVAALDNGARARTATRGAVAAGRIRVLILANTEAGMARETHTLGRTMDALSRPCL